MGGQWTHVLVDAPCTSDASVPTQKRTLALFRAQNGTPVEDVVARREARERGANLQALQRALLSNGFRALAPGGVLLYVTCSTDPAQNEEIINWFLERENHRAFL